MDCLFEQILSLRDWYWMKTRTLLKAASPYQTTAIINNLRQKKLNCKTRLKTSRCLESNCLSLSSLSTSEMWNTSDTFPSRVSESHDVRRRSPMQRVKGLQRGSGIHPCPPKGRQRRWLTQFQLTDPCRAFKISTNYMKSKIIHSLNQFKYLVYPPHTICHPVGETS